jgi:hypothetical protein
MIRLQEGFGYGLRGRKSGSVLRKEIRVWSQHSTRVDFGDVGSWVAKYLTRELKIDVIRGGRQN